MMALRGEKARCARERQILRGDFSKFAQRREGHWVASKCLPRRPQDVVKTVSLSVADADNPAKQ
jgi:hypothetical protein